MADKLGKYVIGGEEAGNYAPHVKVWSEMGVRVCLQEQNKRTEKLERGIQVAIKALEEFADGIDPELFCEFSDIEDLPKVEAQNTADTLKKLLENSDAQ